ncbi:MAG: hypothetical protein V7719_16710 [Psychroserpens sp.]|uniref:hypothetical protein n=1 Tax=Psychroserpens sp. TaxID=2020870 RepID=UPI003001A0CA
MKNLLNNTIACVIVMTACFNCSVESIENEQLEQSLFETPDPLDPCSNQDPQARITNSGTVAVTLQIATIDGTILHTVTNLASGSASGYLTFAADDIIFNVSKNTTGISDEKVVYTMEQCMSFDIEVDLDNYLTNSIPVNL